jgi:hypothetical protein
MGVIYWSAQKGKDTSFLYVPLANNMSNCQIYLQDKAEKGSLAVCMQRGAKSLGGFPYQSLSLF